MRKLYLFLALLACGVATAMGTTYTVKCNLTGGGVTYTNTEYAEGATIEAESLAEADLTAKAVSGYVSQVSIAGTVVYVDYYDTTKDYFIKHSTASTAQPGWFLTYNTTGITTREVFDHTCLWKIVQGSDANTVYIETEDAVSGERRYVQQYVNNNSQIVYGSTPKPYAIEHISDTEVVLHSLAAHGTTGNLNGAAQHHYLHMNGNDKVVGWTSDALPSHWQLPVEITTGTKTFKLTDEAGTTYRTSTTAYLLADGTVFAAGELNLTGCTGLTTSDLVESTDGSVTGRLNFPFPVSSATQKNWTYIGEKPGGTLCHWYTKDDNATTVYANNQNTAGAMPTNEAADHDRYLFAVMPSFADGAFTFTIYNKKKGKYLHHDAIAAGTDQVALTLADTGSPFTYGNTNRSNGHGFFTSDGTHCISVGSMRSEQTLNMLLCDGSHYTSHEGFNDIFETPADFDALMARLTAWSNYPLGEGVGKYTATDAWTTKKNEAAPVVAGTSYWTAAQFNTALAVAAPTLNAVPAGFYTFKSAGHSLNDASNDYYLCGGAKGSNLTTATAKGANTIFYFAATDNGTHNLYAYDKGYYLDGHNVVSSIKNAQNGDNGSQYYVQPAAAACLCPVSGNTEAVYGQYRLKYWEGYVKDNGSAVTTESNENDQWTGWVVEPVSALPVSVAEGSYTTFSCPVAFSLPEGWKAYSVTEVGESAVRLNELTGVIPANTGVILEGTGDALVTLGGTATTVEGNRLLANVTAANHSVADGHYFLGMVDGAQGFYKQTADGTLVGHKAYLPAQAAGVKAFLGLGIATGIESAQTSEPAQRAIYDLQGRRLAKLQKGVNVVNGVKVIVR